ncbi:HAD-IIA family hydrolase [Polymorphospora rubra]|uniref:Haloacid dehalogenase n=1 Tax=Polymorphospora rubra TaxID=338584 RepID=A0A810N3A4_9ACTN|nr:HAD-IIA family hydrolase [Polymorphospora rubra]BCJ67942.1 haloacid dehalogenase [Polymorphospora rubra]
MSGPRQGRLVDAYDLVIFDLDGVVYLIDEPIPGAVEAIGRLHDEGRSVSYATNNASRRAADVAELLTGMGVPAGADEVVTSAGAAAAVLAGRLAPGDRVLVVGADALRDEIGEVGLVPVGRADEEPVAVVQGYGPRVGWAELAEAALAVRAGAIWVATNTDRTLPSPRGPLPGNGSLVAVLRTALDRDPDIVVGKPAPGLFRTGAERVGASRPLVVGDRLDTDIEGAVRAGMDSLLVLTGVSDARELLGAPAERRPTFVGYDLRGLFDVDGVVRVPAGEPASGGWRVTGDGLRLDGSGSTLDALAALCAAAWSRSVAREVAPAAGSEPARAALRELGLTG